MRGAVLNEAPLTLDLPEPVAAELRIGAAHPRNRRPRGGGGGRRRVRTSAAVGATVRFADGSTKDLSTDGRVALALADGSGACADVVATLGDADLEGGGQLRMKTFGDHIDAACDSVTVEATVTLGGGTYVLRASATVGIARFEMFALSAQLYPAPQSGAAPHDRPAAAVPAMHGVARARAAVGGCDAAADDRRRQEAVSRAVELRDELVEPNEDSGGATLAVAFGDVSGGAVVVDAVLPPTLGDATVTAVLRGARQSARDGNASREQRSSVISAVAGGAGMRGVAGSSSERVRIGSVTPGAGMMRTGTTPTTIARRRPASA